MIIAIIFYLNGYCNNVENGKSLDGENIKTVEISRNYLSENHFHRQKIWNSLFKWGVEFGLGYILDKMLETNSNIRCNTILMQYPNIGVLDRRVSSLESSLYSLSNRVDRINNRLDVLESVVSGLTARLSYLESVVQLNSQKINILEYKVSNLEDWLPVGAFDISTSSNLIANNMYQSVDLNTLILIKNIELGLKFNLDQFNINEKYPLTQKENTLKNSIKFIRFGSENDPAYLQIGNINTSDHSFLFRDYRNNTIYNDYQLGLKTGVKSVLFGLDFMKSDIDKNTINVGQAYLRPLTIFPLLIHSLRSSNLPFLLTKVSFGYVKDLNFNEEINMKYATLHVPILTFSNLGSHFRLEGFGNYASISGLGSGKGYGAFIEGAYNFNSLSLIYEYREYGKQFQAGIFNPFYELDRHINNYNYFQLINEDNTSTIEQVVGIQFNLLRTLHINGIYGYVNDSNNAPNDYLHIDASLTFALFNKRSSNLWFELGSSFDKRNLNSIGDISVSDLQNWTPDVLYSSFATLKFSFFRDLAIKAQIQDSYHTYNKSQNLEIESISNRTVNLSLQYNFGFEE